MKEKEHEKDLPRTRLWGFLSCTFSISFLKWDFSWSMMASREPTSQLPTVKTLSLSSLSLSLSLFFSLFLSSFSCSFFFFRLHALITVFHIVYCQPRSNSWVILHTWYQFSGPWLLPFVFIFFLYSLFKSKSLCDLRFCFQLRFIELDRAGKERKVKESQTDHRIHTTSNLF